MGESAQEPRQLTRPTLPPCEQAQADGVPCTEAGRHCEICEHVLKEWREAQQNQADGAG